MLDATNTAQTNRLLPAVQKPTHSPPHSIRHPPPPPPFSPHGRGQGTEAERHRGSWWSICQLLQRENPHTNTARGESRQDALLKQCACTGVERECPMEERPSSATTMTCTLAQEDRVGGKTGRAKHNREIPPRGRSTSDRYHHKRTSTIESNKRGCE